MAIQIGEVPHGFLADSPGNAILVPLPPQNGGLGWGRVWISFGADFGDVKLRVAIYNGPAQAWRIAEVQVPAAGSRVGVPVQDGDQKASIARIKAGPGDSGVQPCGWLLETILKA
jgi:hypothetical protein